MPEEKRRETWEESVTRMKDMHLRKYPHAKDDIEWAFDFVYKKKVLGSQRALQMGGIPVERINARLFNCIASYADRPRFFQECLFLLLCGCGTGFSVQRHHVEKLPSFTKARQNKETLKEKTHVIVDSIEGWADSLGIIISSYLDDPVFPEYNNTNLKLDYSIIREKGSPLSHGCGKAPGPEPLKTAHNEIISLLERCVKNGQDSLRPIDVYDIVMHSSDAVIAGGIRRSATICLFDFDDEEMATAKTGNWFIDNPQRGRSNNSAVLDRNKTTKKEFDKLIQSTKEFGEPGFVWTDYPESSIYNPCQPSWAKLLTPNGIRQLKDVNVGDQIWSEEGWTTVTKKWSTGINDVYKYETTSGRFYGTENHKVMSHGKKVKIKDAESIDIITGEIPNNQNFNIQDVMDGIVIGDGFVHKASNNKVYLTIGKDDQDYFDDYVNNYIIGPNRISGNHGFNIKTTITAEDLPKTFLRSVPDRFLYGSIKTKLSFLRGLYSANGSICGKRITLCTASKQIIEDVQCMLSSVGIRSYYTTTKESVVEFGNGQYGCKQSYILNISTDRSKFRNLIGFIQKYKNQRVEDAISNANSSSRFKSTYDIVSFDLVSTEETWDITVDNNSHTYWTDGCNVSNCLEIALYGYDDKGNSGWQGCVHKDTPLITRDGISKIGDVVNKEVEIWNGKKWSKVRPILTRENQKMVEVHFNDGSSLVCTEDHRFSVSYGSHQTFKEVYAKDLMGLSKRSIRTEPFEIDYQDGFSVDNAYTIGFAVGDEHIKGKRGQVYSYNKYADSLDEIFSWNKKSILNFIAGLADSDGSNTDSNCIRIYLSGKDRSNRIQLLLLKCGIRSSVNLMSCKGSTTNKGERSEDQYYVQITDCTQIPCYRLDTSRGKKPNGKGKYQVIRNVIPLEERYDAYCFEEQERHMGVFNTSLTYQCNLSTINGKKIKSLDDYKQAAKAAAIIGTLQAGYTEFPYLGEVSEYIFRRESLLGVSITGIMDSPDILLNPDNQKEVANYVKEINKQVAKKIGINPAARTTCLKPEGTASCVLGTSSGIHPHHARRYFRHTQANNMESPVQHFAQKNPDAIEDSVWSKNKTDSVIAFAIEVEKGAKIKNEMSALELLNNVKSTQINWVTEGRDQELCVLPNLNHNVSNTITVRDYEWEDVGDFIYDNRNYFTGVSLIPESGDKDYPQAPFTTVHTAREIVSEYGDCSLFASGIIELALERFDKNLWAACSSALMNNSDLTEKQQDWVEKVYKFANKYMDGNSKRVTYLLKDVYLWHKWLFLKESYQDVDYTGMKEDEDNTKLTEEVACGGGACEIL